MNILSEEGQGGVKPPPVFLVSWNARGFNIAGILGKQAGKKILLKNRTGPEIQTVCSGYIQAEFGPQKSPSIVQPASRRSWSDAKGSCAKS